MLHTQMILCYPDTIQIHSRHGSHSDIHSKFKYSYSSDTHQKRAPFFCSYKNQSPDTVQWHSRHGYHFDAHSSHLQHTVQQTFLDGIFKPISDKILSHLQMTSLSPFPQLCFDECKFMGTLVSNRLLPSSHERQTRQSNS